MKIEKKYPPECWECDRKTSPLIRLGDDVTDWESISVFICKECLKKALSLLDKED